MLPVTIFEPKYPIIDLLKILHGKVIVGSDLSQAGQTLDMGLSQWIFVFGKR